MRSSRNLIGEDEDLEAAMNEFKRGYGNTKVVRVATRQPEREVLKRQSSETLTKEILKEDVPRDDLYSEPLKIPLDKQLRIDSYKFMPPSTQKFIIAIYNTYDNYIFHSNPDKDPNRRLFDACMLHSQCFIDSICAVRGLQILNVPVDEPTNVCHLGGCKDIIEDPVRKFDFVMRTICNDPNAIASYRETLI